MNRRFSLLTILGIGISAQGILSCQKKTEEPPNIIFIMSDDHAYQAISAYGGDLARLAPTPNIDRIADEGLRFDRCFVTNSICGPSRATILTGKYSHMNGFIDNRFDAKFDSSQMTFPKILQKAGYQTAMIGKWHLGSQPTGFDYWNILPGQGAYYNPDFVDTMGLHHHKGYATEIITEKTLQWLRIAKEKGKPFMLMMHHKAPHRSWEPGPNELGMYESVTFPEPETLFDDYSGRGTGEHSQKMTIYSSLGLVRDLKLSDVPRRGLDSAQLVKWNTVYNPVLKQFKEANLRGEDLLRFKYQRYMKDYLSCIAAVDKSVGKVLDYLKETGLDKNTIIIYTSDQGFYLGEHGWFDKRWMFEQSLRTPLLIRWPGVIKSGNVNNDIVSTLDFAETILDIAGAVIPEQMQGKSFLPILKGVRPADWRTAHYYHYYEHPSEHYVPRHYGITTAKYKLIHLYYDIDEWELFDLKNDPNELKNVYNDPVYSAVKDSLNIELKALMVKYQDSDSLAMQFVERYLKNPGFEYWKHMPQDNPYTLSP